MDLHCIVYEVRSNVIWNVVQFKLLTMAFFLLSLFLFERFVRGLLIR